MNEIETFDKNLPLFFQYFKTNIEANNELTGKVFFSTAALIPSNGPKKNVWNLIMTGFLDSNAAGEYNVVYDFGRIPDYQDKISFDNNNIVSGTLEICGKVLDATKIIGKDYFFSKDNLTLTISLNPQKWGFRIKPSRLTLINYSLYIGT